MDGWRMLFHTVSCTNSCRIKAASSVVCVPVASVDQGWCASLQQFNTCLAYSVAMFMFHFMFHNGSLLKCKKMSVASVNATRFQMLSDAFSIVKNIADHNSHADAQGCNTLCRISGQPVASIMVACSKKSAVNTRVRKFIELFFPQICGVTFCILIILGFSCWFSDDFRTVFIISRLKTFCQVMHVSLKFFRDFAQVGRSRSKRVKKVQGW